MNRRSFLVPVPPVVLAAAGAFGAGRLSRSTPRPPAAPPCGASPDGGRGAQPPDPSEPPAAPLPGAAPRLVPPLPTPAAAERARLEEWLDLAARPTWTAVSGC
jgi:hypothetical protein